MRRLLLLYGSTILLVLAILVGAGELMVEVHPFAPGQPLYSLQEILEDARLAIARGPASRAELALALAQKHLEDVRELAGTDLEKLALEAFNRSLNEVLRSVAILPPEESATTRAHLLALTNDALEVFDTLGSGTEVERTIAKVTRIRQLTLLKRSTGADFLALIEATIADDGQIVLAQSANGNRVIDPRAVPFPAQSLGSHNFFPLTGVHTTAACQSCHLDGVYRGTPRECEDCHLNPHPERFGDVEPFCTVCHNTTDFRAVNFDHVAFNASDGCESCHAPDVPADHYDGACSDCHVSTTDWSKVQMDHTGLTDCQ
ncbi:MAG: hypothetical protein D6791_03985, partial [Chloroflexi bacterium]